ncbi:ubiquinol oxidase subunit II [Cohnella yongneupensis]|uniref:Quinol oxidase subunit 2 n=1 Tax=Cohnella yongneupensis TaxID=425006 RepID=A0ABW0R3Q1_9BACL
MATKMRRWAAAVSLVAMTVLMAGCSDKFGVLNPKGAVGKQQLDLILISTALCLVVILPVLVITFVIIWRYRQRTNSKAMYAPEWEHNTKLEVTWWGIPILIIAILAVITINYTYKLEPSKALESAEKPLVIQVTSLDWKWLFQYPDQKIATVNYFEFPANVPVRFELTSDAPMNSFWIPQLGGQIYTMSGMKMTLNLIADEPGDYMGSGANFSGKDFAKMSFVAKATSKQDFDKWVADIKRSTPKLTDEGYAQLAKPSTTDTMEFSDIPDGLFDRIVNKYGAHEGHSSSSEHNEHEGMDMDADMDMSNMDMDATASEHHH